MSRELAWSYAPLSEYLRPQDAGREVRSGIGGLWARVRGGRGRVEDQVRELRGVSSGLLDRVVPAPRWDEMVPALDLALRDWLGGRSPPAQLVVGAPGSGAGEVVQRWGRQREASLVPAPDPDAILDGGAAWLAALGEASPSVVVIPHLEHCYLRHARGFTLVRGLLERLASQRTRVLLGCDSWAFDFLERALGAGALPPLPLALAACPAPQLAAWFRRVGVEAGVAAFRRAGTGAIELGCEAETERAAPSELLQRIAVTSRGVPGVAWALWRESLRVSVEDDVDEKSWAAAAADRGHTVWVHASVDPIGVPAGLGRTALWALHALLLHGGLRLEALAAVLPLGRGETTGTLELLGRLRLVEKIADRWRVTLAAYPAVRRRLADEDLVSEAC